MNPVSRFELFDGDRNGRSVMPRVLSLELVDAFHRLSGVGHCGGVETVASEGSEDGTLLIDGELHPDARWGLTSDLSHRHEGRSGAAVESFLDGLGWIHRPCIVNRRP
jgi:hypothetical protein